MLSAPATIPPTIDRALTSAAVPAPLATPTSFTFSANRIVGMNPAYAIRSGSSNAASNSADLRSTFTTEMLYRSSVVEA